MAGRSTTPRTGGWNRIPIESTSPTVSRRRPSGGRESPLFATAEDAPASILLLDEGKAKAAPQASDRINRGEQVLAVDLILTGEAQPLRRKTSDSHRYAQLLATVGDRPLGIRASHLLALARWLKDYHGAPEVRVEAQGFRSQVVALLGAALDPTAFSEVRVDKGMKSLDHLLAKPVPYEEAPELFCLGLFPAFDLERLIPLAEPVRVVQRFDSSDSGDESPAITRRPGSGDILVPVFSLIRFMQQRPSPQCSRLPQPIGRPAG